MNSDILSGATAIAKWLNMNERTIRSLATNGRLPVFRIGAKICARKSVLNSWIADQERANVKGRIAA